MNDAHEFVALHLKAHPWLSADMGSHWMVSGKGTSVHSNWKHFACTYVESLAEYNDFGDGPVFVMLTTMNGYGFLPVDSVESAYEVKLVRVDDAEEAR